jgi:excisionase family DNA binding protein
MAGQGRKARNGDVLTSGQVATICGVAARTAGKWIDSGKLKGYRIPGSQDRRVHLDDLKAFMAAQGWPAAMIPGDAGLLLAVGAQPHDGFEATGYSVTHAATAFDAGSAFADGPAAVVVSMDLGRIEAGMIAAAVAARGVPCVALTDQPPHEVTAPGFCGVVSPRLSRAELATAIRDCVATHEAAAKAAGRPRRAS